MPATPNLLLSITGQYNSVADEVSSLVRLRWRYWPGSDLIVVYQERLFAGEGRGIGESRSDFRQITAKLRHRFDAVL